MARIAHTRLCTGKNSKGQDVSLFSFEHKGLTKYNVLMWPTKNSRHTRLLRPVLSFEQAIKFFQDAVDAEVIS